MSQDPGVVAELHEQGEVCTTRPGWRSGGKETAVKVYTILHESRYVMVSNVPAVGARGDLLSLFALHGPILEYRLLDDYKTADQFTDVYWIKYSSVEEAHNAKRDLDDYEFYGTLLHVTYAPEFESVEETKQKLDSRRAFVNSFDATAQHNSGPNSTCNANPTAPISHSSTTTYTTSHIPSQALSPMVPLKRKPTTEQPTAKGLDWEVPETRSHNVGRTVTTFPTIPETTPSMSKTILEIREKLKPLGAPPPKIARRGNRR
ncbi:RNA-binding protein 48 [Pelomyxa schiedti]|nr:RNA-binding protein 48 [Pelomyxa schiedti]